MICWITERERYGLIDLFLPVICLDYCTGSLCTAVPLPSKKSGRERLCYGGGNRVPRRVVSLECVGNDLIGFHKNYFNLFCIIPKP